MSYSLENLRYGWQAVVGLGILAGAGIYVAVNRSHYVTAADEAEIVLAIVERCMGTQYGTNADGTPQYRVAPPVLVQTWVTSVVTEVVLTNQYTNGIDGTVTNVVYTNWIFTYTTNLYTNVFTYFAGSHWSDEKIIFLQSLDDKIKDLVQWYVDTNSLSPLLAPTGDIRMLTVTGLWDSLQIGDRTNRFTQSPARTNSITTNFLICYTSYWPAGSIVTNCYTSSVNQSVNFAITTSTWVTWTNWPQVVVTNTNALVLVPSDAWERDTRIYAEALQERYKVLQAMKVTSPAVTIARTNQFQYDSSGVYPNLWLDAVALTEANDWEESSQDYPWCSFGIGGEPPGQFAAFRRRSIYNFQTCAATGIAHTTVLQTIVKAEPRVYFGAIGVDIANSENAVFDGGGDWAVADEWVEVLTSTSLADFLIVSEEYGSLVNEPTWCADPGTGPIEYYPWSGSLIPCHAKTRGYYIADKRAITAWDFFYATNRYW